MSVEINNDIVNTGILDCHCHIEPAWLQNDALTLRGMLGRCTRYGVPGFVASVDCSCGAPEHALADLRDVFQAAGYPLRVSLGFSPPSRADDLADLDVRLDQAVESVRRLSREPEVMALGEAGLDFFRPLAQETGGRVRLSPATLAPGAVETRWLQLWQAAQTVVFRRWVKLAGELHLPLVLHSRDAHSQTIAILKEGRLDPARVMFHCFGGTPAEAAEAAAKGYWISIPSSVVHRAEIREAARATPIHRLLIETDAPYHSPIVGLWKEAGAQALIGMEPADAASFKGTPAFRHRRRERFADLLERDLPGLSFTAAGGGEPEPAVDHFASSDARYLNEPAFVRFGARWVAEIKALSPEAMLARLAQNGQRFFSSAS